jgi:nucleotide-binding universal stress UspA family protein
MTSNIRSLLIAVDASPEARAAAVCGGALSARLGARAMLLHVSARNPRDVPPWLRSDHQTAYTHDDVRGLLEEYADLVRDAGCDDVAIKVRVGPTPRVIADSAAEFDADLIVLGRRGLGDAEGLILGSVSHEVEHLVECPVMTVTGQTPACRMQNILLAVDDTAHALHAAEVAGELAAASDAKLTIMYVMGDGPPLGSGDENARRVEYRRITDREAEERRAVGILGQAARRAQRAGALNIERVIDSGNPARVISDRATAIAADAICLGRRGLGSIGGLLHRSTSHKVSKQADGTVITVK